MEMHLVILGAGTFATEVLDCAEAAGCGDVAGFLVNVATSQTEHNGRPVWFPDTLPLKPDECRLAAGIVSNRRRGFVETMLARGYRFTSVVHPHASVSRRARIAEGCA